MASSIAPLIPWSFAITFVSLTAALWSRRINVIVPEPYLDEVFHIRQAQAYLRGLWDVWDPKLTTPAGLYFVSWGLIKARLESDVRCALTPISTEVSALRSTNWSGSLLLAWVVRLLLLLNVENRDEGIERKDTSKVLSLHHPDWAEWELIHTTINIYLFPPLFFFYGLYYTDVLSALSVLYAYRCHLARRNVRVLLAGLLSLLFRQTNIFWVSVFLGGLELCRIIPKGRPYIEFPGHPNFRDIIVRSWQQASAYDPLISEAYFEDYIKTSLSYAVAGLANLSIVMWLSPYIIVLGAFAEFVFWNGGVVLGDKENHVASIHLTQMMYIWPYFAFFSWPLLYHQCLPETIRPFSFPGRYPRKVITCITMAVMLVIVRYNTIVHPFTLADNRHYMFYVFRILLRHSLIKYLAVPIYFGCAWVTLTALGGVPPVRQVIQRGSVSKKKQLPEEEPVPSSLRPRDSPKKRSNAQKSTLSSKSSRAFTPSRKETPQQTDMAPLSPKKQKKQKQRLVGGRASFIIIWLLATALSIITTPLVEPRYLIVPWLIWRLHMAIPRPEEDSAPPAERPNTVTMEVFKAVKAVLYERHDHRLWIETMWFLSVNLATGYIFLYWGFAWPQEAGKVQRFMW